MKFDPLEYPNSSKRMMLYSKNGMVATSQPLASQVGLDILKSGGNAIDAAIGTAAALTVLKPTSNGIGGDAFAIIWEGDQLKGLNASGPSPNKLSIENLKNKGIEKMPKYGWEPVTVPGAPAAWTELSKNFGNLKLNEILQPAIDYAKDGFPILPSLRSAWKKYYNIFSKKEQEYYKYWLDTFTVNGKAPKIGEVWNSIDHAKTLKKIANTNAKSFYEGELASKIDKFSKDHDGYITKKDLENFSPDWVDPMSTNYRGYDVWEMPPNTQGVAVLMALNILKNCNLENKRSPKAYHKQIEAMKLALSTCKKHITDPEDMKISQSELLSKNNADNMKEKITKTAIKPTPEKYPSGDTVYLATADDKGNMVSYIQSNYSGFGSGLVVPETGIALQNRGNLFSLNPNHDNCLKPNKRTYHTLIPGFITKENKPIGPFGVMGGFMQPQGHLQVIMNAIDFNHNPQAALDAPRWYWKSGKTVEIEQNTPKYIIKSLSRKGHNIQIKPYSDKFGRGQIIWKKKKTLFGGTEPRTEGTIACW